jgi:hypothetical protein
MTSRAIPPQPPARARLLLLAAVLAGACMPPQEPDGSTGSPAGTGGDRGQGGAGAGTGGRGGSGGASGSGGSSGSGGGSGSDAAAPDTASAGAGCSQLRTRRAGADGTLGLTIEPTLGGKPLVFGEANRFEAATITPTNFRFYMADPYLVRAGGQRVPVDLVTAEGQALAYNVTLVSLESPETLAVHLAAPVGAYEGFGFLFGVSDACNMLTPAAEKPPLSHTSQMTWPHEAGYLFLRYEAKVEGAALPGTIHMGGRIGQIFAPEVTLMGKLTVATGKPAPLPLKLALDQLLAGVAMEANVPSTFVPPTPEAIAGEHLRQNLAKVKVFTLPVSP